MPEYNGWYPFWDYFYIDYLSEQGNFNRFLKCEMPDYII